MRLKLLVSCAFALSCAASEDSTPDPVDGGGQLDLPSIDTTRPDTVVGPGQDLGQPIEDVVVAPGTFGAPCQGNGECESGYCVEAQVGFVCTDTCISECPEGYDCKAINSGSDDLAFLCLPRFVKYCTPCAVDTNCPGGACRQVDGEPRCTPSCSSADDCLEGFDCQSGYCEPTTGSCTCRPGADGGKRSCVSSSDLGTCFGVQACDAASGWGACSASVPAPETCNGIDDDCNGLIDDGLAEAEACANEVAGVGSCPGVRACLGAKGWVCQGRTPAPETCDFDDNDCDGLVDEDFKDAGGVFSTDVHCGTCGNACAAKFPHGTGRCGGTAGSPICVVDTCDPDYSKVNDFQCALPPDVSCQACSADSDCFGGTCLTLDGQQVCASPCGAAAKACGEGFSCQAVEGGERCVPVTGSCVCGAKNGGATRACSATNAAGTCYGSQICDSAVGWSQCTAATPSPETCNGKDDDCNGAADDGVPPPQSPCATTNAHGTCAGQWRCSDDGPGLSSVDWWCDAATPAEEVCDYADNDCDGVVDNGVRDPATGQYLHGQHCGACGIACDGTLPNATASCQLVAGKARCQVEECDSGYYAASPLACLPLTDALCVPCVSDASCGSPGDMCVSLDNAKYCARDCAAGNAHGNPEGQCPSGYACTPQAGGKKQCLPVTGSCTCLVAKDAGVVRSCVNSGPSGSCYGVQSCDPSAGWSACSATAPGDEVCDGKDNDCDAVIDDVPGRGDPCTVSNAFGSCGGVKNCVAGSAALVCVGPAPAVETCNHKDDDCDDQVDEGLGVGTVCSAGVGQCLTYGINDCSPSGVACTAVAGATKTEVCDGLDNDCDGLTDEGPAWTNKGTVCTAGAGVCQTVGTFGCDPANPGGALVCGAKAGSGSAEECNGLDDDCDTQTDEGATWADKGTTCTAGKGVCLKAGVRVCDPAAPKAATICNVQPGTPGTEVCDNLDNNCDGSTDEPFSGKGTVCTAGVGACLRFGVGVCDSADPTKTVCNAVPGAKGTETCDGVDNDCDTTTDEGWMSGGKYNTHAACGNCYTDCTSIFGLPNAYGICDASGAPKCLMKCCKAGDTNAACTGGSWVDVNLVPTDGCEFLQDPDAIYVSATDTHAADGSGCGLAPYDALAGTWPCATIAGGLTAAGATGRSKVLVAAAAYNETVTLVAGKNVYGGYNPTTWTRDPSTNLTAIFGQTASGHRKTVIASNITGKATVFDGFVVYGESATGPGENSYGIWVSGSDTSLSLTNNVVWAGYGGPGSAGANGASGTDGLDGAGGANAHEPGGKFECAQTCKAAGNAESNGGAAGSLTCGGVNVSGGAGGKADCPDWDESWQACAGCPVGNPTGAQTVTTSGVNAPGGGAGGLGGCDALTSACFAPACACIAPQNKQTCPNGTASLDGQNGSSGSNGGGGAAGPATAGTVTAGNWQGASGAPGASGTPGRGGGGGGAGGGVEGGKAPGCTNGFSDIGGSGGGGGSGGCGGLSGGGGGSGGGSFAVFVVAGASLPTLSGNVLHRGVGGPGGRGGGGGNGGVGGNGGLGGNGGQAGTTYWCAGGGSKGGEGGAGGHGGGGSGGPGGPSYGLYVSGATPASWKSGNTFATPGGAGGPGGQGGGSGAGGASGANGATGLSAGANY